MGRRYRSIVEHLGHDWEGEDLTSEKEASPRDCDAIIIATPTDTHTKIIRQVMKYGKPILCEKPICKDTNELQQLMADCVLSGTKIQMVNQYDYLFSKTMRDTGDSHWDFYRSGSDGLAWDCIQIIDNAHSFPRLSNRSPYWDCVINGQRLAIENMDSAYVTMIDEWLKAPKNGISRILDAHEKVVAWEESCQKAS